MSPRPTKLLVVCPSWIGDVVMATPTFRRLRSALPGAFIGALVRPGLDQLLAGSDFFDELHIDRAQGVMGPKLVASRLRPRRYDAAVLLTNSFSTALITRLAFIPRRIGYDRDGRGILLTDRLKAPRRADGRWSCISAVDYYLRLADAVLDPDRSPPPPLAAGLRVLAGSPPSPRLELATTPEQEREADRILGAAGIAEGQAFAIINPGANNPDKRWPAERFGQLAAHLARRHQLPVLVNGSPGERELVEQVVACAHSPSQREGAGGWAGGAPSAPDLATASPRAVTCANIIPLPPLNPTLGSLKSLIRRAAILITNDTGPRHIAAAFDAPTVALFGPTDPRWTTLPASPAGTRIDLVADPTLPPDQIADDHPERCRIDRITLEAAMEAADAAVAGRPRVRPRDGASSPR